MKKYQVRKNYVPWMYNSTKEKIKARNDAQKKASETKDSEDWKAYKAQRNSVNSTLRKEKELWKKKKLEDCLEDSRSTWQNLKNWLGWRSGGPPTKLLENGKMFFKPVELANIMNQFFVNKVRNLRSNLPQSTGDPLDLTRRLLSKNESSFTLRAVHPDEIAKIISTMKSSKSSGKDNIDTYVLKLAKVELTHVVEERTRLFWNKA